MPSALSLSAFPFSLALTLFPALFPSTYPFPVSLRLGHRENIEALNLPDVPFWGTPGNTSGQAGCVEITTNALGNG